jgi:hypothetical protein
MDSRVVFTPDDTDWRLRAVGPGLLLDVPKHVGRALERSAQPVLHAGRWCLRPLQGLSSRPGPSGSQHSATGALVLKSSTGRTSSWTSATC